MDPGDEVAATVGEEEGEKEWRANLGVCSMLSITLGFPMNKFPGVDGLWSPLPCDL